MLYGFVYHITYICSSRRIYPLNPGVFSIMTVLCDRKLWVLLYSWNLPISIGKMDIIIAEDLGGKKAPSDRNDSSKIQWKTQTPETLSLHLAVSLEAPERVFSIGYYWIYYTRWGKPNCSNITSILYFHCDKKQTFQENNHDSLLLLRYAMIPWMYLISRIFPSSDVAFISYISLNFIFGLCTMLMTAMPRLLAIISKAQVSHWLRPISKAPQPGEWRCPLCSLLPLWQNDWLTLFKERRVCFDSQFKRTFTVNLEPGKNMCRRKLVTSWSARTSLGTRYPLQSSAVSDFMLKFTKSFKIVPLSESQVLSMSPCWVKPNQASAQFSCIS